MSEKTFCNQCGSEITDESPTGDYVERKPCRKCGFLGRRFEASARISATSNVAVADFSGTVEIPFLASVLVQAIIQRGDKTSDGELVVAVAPVWKQIVKILQRSPNDIFTIDPRTWEEIIAGAYAEAGFDEVILTPRSGDFGRDVIAVKRGLWSIRVIDQVKVYAPHLRVPADDVRALLGVLLADRSATKGLVTTTSDFAPRIATDPFIAPFIPHRLELVNGKNLVARLSAIALGQPI